MEVYNKDIKMFIGDAQKKKIEQIGRKYNLKLILLYGSYAKGKNQNKSDLDLAVLGNKPLTLDAMTGIYGTMEQIFGNKAERELDIVSLHRADPLFCYQVAKDSILLYGNITEYNEFRAYAFSRYFDSRDLLKLEKILTKKFQSYLNKKYVGH